MTAKQIALILIPLNIILAYLVFNSIDSEVEFQKEAKVRISENVQKLKDLRQVQIAYKKANNTYAKDFKELLNFLENDSIVIVKAIGETPDSLTEAQALELEIISRDTAYIDAKSYIFNEIYAEILSRETSLSHSNSILKDEKKLAAAKAEHDQIKKEIETLKNKFPLYRQQKRFIPHTINKCYNIDAGSIEKGNVRVQVFEISTTYSAIFTKLVAENKKYDLNALLKVGSMNEASLNGNWGE